MNNNNQHPAIEDLTRPGPKARRIGSDGFQSGRGMRVPLSIAAPLILGTKGVQTFSIANKDPTLDQSAPDAAAFKFMAKESDSITFNTPVVGVISLFDWQFEAITIVAAASPCSDLAVIWMQQITQAQTWEELEDPEIFVGLVLKLAT